jgi:hypothetical protein
MPGAAQLSRIEGYRNQPAIPRSFACPTRYPESKARLLALTGGFDKLAEQAATRETAANAA